MENTLLGAGMKDLYDYHYQTSELESYVEFHKKDGTPVNPEDTFWLGMTTKDYL